MSDEAREEPDNPMTWGDFVREMERHGVTADSPIHKIELYRPQEGENFVLGNPFNADGRIEVNR